MSQTWYRARLWFYKRFGTPVRVHLNQDHEATQLIIANKYPHVYITYFNNYPITLRSVGRACWIDIKKFFNLKRQWYKWRTRNDEFPLGDLEYFNTKLMRHIHIPASYLDPESHLACNFNTYYFLRANDAMMFRLSLGGI